MCAVLVYYENWLTFPPYHGPLHLILDLLGLGVFLSLFIF